MAPLNFGPIRIVFLLEVPIPSTSLEPAFPCLPCCRWWRWGQKYTSARKAWATKEFGCYSLSFLHCKEVAWYVDLDFFSSSCWLNLQVHNLFQPLNNTIFFSEQCGYPAAKTLQHGKKQRQSWGGKVNVLLFSFDITAIVWLLIWMCFWKWIRYPLIHWLVIAFCINRAIYTPKSLYSNRNNCQWWLSRKSRWFPTFSHKHITFKSSTWFDMFHYKNCCKSGSQHSIQSVATMEFLPWRLLEESTALILNILLITLVWY